MASKRQLPGLMRTTEKIAPKKNFFLFCEGKNTEPDYFEALARKYSSAFVRVIPLGAVGVPRTIADAAIKEAKGRGLIKGSRVPLDSFEEGDEVWAVFDRDEHPHYEEAVNNCKQKGIGVARSNPCFEVWIILHFLNYNRADNRHQTQSHLRELHPAYDPKKSKTLNFSEILDRVEIAEDRAERQIEDREREGAPHGVPSTTVHLLTKSIRIASQRKK